MKTFHRIVHDLCQAYSEDEARALARWLCEECFHLTQTDLLLDKDNNLSADDLAKSQEFVHRLLRHEPIQYILGYTEFCGHRFLVGPGVLIPRPETEQLVAHILRGYEPNLPNELHVLDIGTGSGCIALSLALALPKAHVTAWDISLEALSIARRNAAFYPDAHVVFKQVDIMTPPADDCQWDIIVSNPPYVCQSEAATMDNNVLDYEPHQALFVPDNDPLLYYRSIASFAKKHLCNGGSLWFEINQAYGTETSRLIEDFGFRDVEVIRDDFGRDRFIKGMFRKC